MGAGGDLATPLAIDAGALSALKQQAKDSPKAALGAAATQFEALFVQMLLKSMREALPQDGMLSSEQTKTYTGMFDQQIAQQMSKRGIGLRQVLERQLAPTLGGTANARDAAAGKIAGAIGSSDSAATRTLPPAMGATSRVRDAVPGPQSANTQHPQDGAASTTDLQAPSHADASSASRLPANVRAFIEKMRPHAEAAARVVGVPADLLLAQAGLETGWGKSQPKAADGGTSHNVFGIKAGRGWDGAVAVASTTEYVAGAFHRTLERFRSYGSYTEAFQDFGRMITRNARYANAMARTSDPVAYAKSLQQGGYATDPQYADKLVRAIRMVAGQGAAPAAPAQVFAANAVNPSREGRSPLERNT